MSNPRSVAKSLVAIMVTLLALVLVPNLAGPTTAASQPSAAPPHSSSAAPSAPGVPQSPTDNNISFAPVVTYTLSGDLRSIATADFNADNYPDVVTVNGSAVYVFLNNGNGTLAQPISYTVQSTPLYVTVGDFNGDGKPDIAALNYYSSSVSVLLGNGDGTFRPAINSPACDTPYAIVAADFNGDGKTDLAVEGFTTGPGVFILLSNGDGTFQAPRRFEAGYAGQWLAAGDLNHDGKTDLVAASGRASVLLGSGDGTFQSPVQYDIRAGIYQVALGDFYHDGNLDIAATTIGELAVLLGNGDGTFQPYTYFYNSNQPFGIAIGDFNLDGDLDVVTDNSSGNVSAYAGVGDGNFYYANQFTTGGGSPSSVVAVADINRDGKPDVVALADGGIDVLINNTNSNPPSPTPSPTATASPSCGPSALGPWTATGPLSGKLAYVATTSDGTYAYAGGGYYGVTGGTSSESRTIRRYDPATGSWTDLSSFPNGSGYDSVSAVYSPINNKLYFFGGFDFSSNAQNNNFIYDLTTNTWSTGRYMPQVRALMAAGYWNGKIYLVGGLDGSYQPQAQVWEYDPLADTWNTSRADMPVALDDPGYGVVNGHLYVMGGENYPSVYNTVYDYNISSNTWLTRTGMPMGVFGPGSAVVNGNVYLFGGRTSFSGLAPSRKMSHAAHTDTTSPINATQIYSPATDTWVYGPQLREPRNEIGGTAVGTTIIAAGGFNNYGSEVNTTERALVGNCQPQPTLTTTPTHTPAPTHTPTPTATPQPTLCPNPFVDINNNIFFHAINYLYCHGDVNGTDPTHYSPAGTATRGQFAKVVVLAFGEQLYTPSGGTQDFTDVPPSYFAYVYIETGFHNGILSGFDANGCAAHNAQYPCYLPNLPITRGQLTKLVVGATHYPLYTPATGQTFSDVPPSNVFFVSIETAHDKGVINGYPDGTFRPNNNIRRDEMAQIVYKGVTTP